MDSHSQTTGQCKPYGAASVHLMQTGSTFPSLFSSASPAKH